MKKYLFLTILSLIAFAPLAAQKFSVAYVDIQYILKNLPQYETANEQLNMISKRWQKISMLLKTKLRCLPPITKQSRFSSLRI